MGLCWPIQIPPTQKAVLISLADQANDHGSCWPSISGIAERTCFGRTAVIEAIKWLEQAGLISMEKTFGRTNRYQLNITKLRQRDIEPVRLPDQSASRTSPPDVPPPVRLPDQSASRTSPPDVPPPVRLPDQPVRLPDPNRKEPSIDKKEKNARIKKSPELTADDLLADGLAQELAEAFIAHRKEKRARLTELAWSMLKAEALKAGWNLADAVLKTIHRNWITFEAEYVAGQSSGRGPPADGETAYQRSMRKKVAAFAPSIAARQPGALNTVEQEFTDGQFKLIA